eukprot:2733576-Amphidinium_carterae.1
MNLVNNTRCALLEAGPAKGPTCIPQNPTQTKLTLFIKAEKCRKLEDLYQNLRAAVVGMCLGVFWGIPGFTDS